MQDSTQQFTARLMRYSAFAGATTLVGTAGAQIVYTDVSPDVTVGYNQWYDLDLNNDATPDFRFALNQYSSSGVFATSYTFSGNFYSAGNYYRSRSKSVILQNFPASGGTNSFIKTSSAYVGALVYGVAIGGAPGLGYWANGSELLGSSYSSYYFGWSFYSTPGGSASGSSWGPYTYSYYNGPWGGLTRYAGLKISVGGNTHYGWVKLAVGTGYNSFTIMDYAYESTPGVKVETGNTNSFVGIGEGNLNPQVNVFAFNNRINVNVLGAVPGEAEIVVTNTLGQTLATERLLDNKQVIQLAGTASGVYLVSIKTPDEVVTRKVYLK